MTHPQTVARAVAKEPVPGEAVEAGLKVREPLEEGQEQTGASAGSLGSMILNLKRVPSLAGAHRLLLPLAL